MRSTRGRPSAPRLGTETPFSMYSRCEPRIRVAVNSTPPRLPRANPAGRPRRSPGSHRRIRMLQRLEMAQRSRR
eukprot:5379479-Prymnesium_polylepis.1